MTHTTEPGLTPLCVRSGPSYSDIEETRTRLEALARTLDTAFRIPGTSVRIGADAVLNVIPGVGTLVAKALSSYIIYEARRLGVSRTTMARMIANVGVDFVISAIPVVGWFGDAFFRANGRNITLLLAHLDRQSALGKAPARAAIAASSAPSAFGRVHEAV